MWSKLQLAMPAILPAWAHARRMPARPERVRKPEVPAWRTKVLSTVVLIFAATLARAERLPVLAELFTSEGCSSCPPADALLQKLDGEVIVLSEHVDYWDRLGWRDPFSSAQFTLRQEQYSRRLGAEVYTPQLVVDGREAMVGSSVDEVRKAIARAAARPKFPVRIAEVKREGGEAAIAVSIPALPKGRAEVWVAIARDSARSEVRRGENSGRTLTHVAVVRGLTKSGAVNHAEGMEKTVRVPAGTEPSRAVVFLVDAGGQVTGAAFAQLP